MSFQRVGESDLFFSRQPRPCLLWGKNKVRPALRPHELDAPRHSPDRVLEACEAGCCGDTTARRILMHITAELRTGRRHSFERPTLAVVTDTDRPP
jgi:hypothetical protein